MNPLKYRLLDLCIRFFFSLPDFKLDFYVFLLKNENNISPYLMFWYLEVMKPLQYRLLHIDIRYLRLPDF
jgi:hypothetical protein